MEAEHSHETLLPTTPLTERHIQGPENNVNVSSGKVLVSRAIWRELIYPT
jgi:hypothetical protein